MIVMKFGGTSVQDEKAIERVISIVSGRLGERPLVVVSAMAKVTRQLVQIAEDAQNQNSDSVGKLLAALRKRHHDVCNALFSGQILEDCLDKVDRLCQSLSSFVEGVCQIGELSPRSRARIISTGELLSSTVVAAAMNSRGIACNWVDARRLVITDDEYLSAHPDLEITTANTRRIISREAAGAQVVLTQGFISSTNTGATSVLGFEGSDYSAALFGMALDADRVEIWTDVDGIRTADPRVVANTKKIDRLSYDEAAEMSHLGARVLHPFTIDPARRKNIPIMVLNTMNPQGKGSVVSKEDESAAGPKAVAFLSEIDYLEIACKMTGGIANAIAEVFAVFRENNLEVSLVSESFSKLSMTFESGQAGLQAAVEKLSKSYSLTLYKDKAQISVIGSKLLADGDICQQINDCGKVCMMTCGASMMDISAVVDRENVGNMVNEIHNRLF